MALSQSALSELLDAIRAGGSADVMRDAMTLVVPGVVGARGVPCRLLGPTLRNTGAAGRANWSGRTTPGPLPS